MAAAEYVKLAETAGGYFDFFAKAGLQRRGQTGRAIFVASGLAVKNAGAHDRSLRVVAGNLKRSGVVPFAAAKVIAAAKRHATWTNAAWFAYQALGHPHQKTGANRGLDADDAPPLS